MIQIHPHKGAGTIAFGMTRAQVQRAVGRPPRRRTKLSEFDSSEIDFFDRFAVYYDAEDSSWAVEFSRGGESVEYDDFDLFAHPAQEVRAWARPKYDAGIRDLIRYYKTNFPELMAR